MEELITLFLLGIGLSFDSFAISISCGLAVQDIRFNQAFRVACIFAVIQASLFLAGWYFGQSVKSFISAFDHWIAFGLLGLLGCKMIYESVTKKDDDCNCRNNPLNLSCTITMAIATSIDAVVVGISVALFNMTAYKLGTTCIIIGMITGIAVMVGMLIGKKTGSHLGGKAEVLGGVALIAIGTKILIEHISAA